MRTFIFFCPSGAIGAVTLAGAILLGGAATAQSAAGDRGDDEKQMKLWREVDIRRWQGTFPCLGDLDGDGRVDFLLYREGPQTTPGYLVALDHDGEELWSRGDPAIEKHMPDGVYREPALRGIVLVYDLGRDGRSEVVTEFWQDGTPMLYLLDGATGRIERARESPLDLEVRGGRRSRCHPAARIAHLEGRDKPPAVVLKYEASGHVPSRAVALDGELETIWQLDAGPNATGHLPSVGDVDGDGGDEIVLGTLLADDDGRAVWQKEARNHADCTAIFQPFAKPGAAVLISICNTGPAFCLSAAGETIWEKTTDEVSHGQGIWAGNFIDAEPGPEVIILRSGHWGDFITVRGSDGRQLAAFQHRRELKGYPDFPCVVCWKSRQVQSLWIPIDRALVDGYGNVVAELGTHEARVRERLRWGTSKSHVATQAFAVDLCGDERDELVLYQPYHGESIMIFTQADSGGNDKPYVHQESAYNVHSYF
jgi:outer membrane protein assembly factor BamB